MILLQELLRCLPRDHPQSSPRAIDLKAQQLVLGLVKIAE